MAHIPGNFRKLGGTPRRKRAARFVLIVPPLAETAVTGLEMAGERKINGRLWRVEARAGQGALRILCNGKPALGKVPALVAEIAAGIAGMRANA